MKRRDRSSYTAEAKLLKVLANESRLLIVERLREGECTVGELVELVGLEQPTVSRHLSVLRAGGIVDDERRANRVVYRLLIPCVTEFLACASKVLRERGAR